MVRPEHAGQRCTTNNVMFAARVDGDVMLARTEMALDFWLSPFAIQRGNRVEQIGRAKPLRPGCQPFAGALVSMGAQVSRKRSWLRPHHEH
ncbi:MAG: hypothetical protein WAK82_22755 [Streptosporangiaceae bacterium]